MTAEEDEKDGDIVFHKKAAKAWRERYRVDEELKGEKE